MFDDAIISFILEYDLLLKIDFRNIEIKVFLSIFYTAYISTVIGFTMWQYLLNKYKLNKVAIVDFDVHHGNGTQDIFYDNEKVLYISTHQYPFYPGTGGDDERGKYNNIFNVPLPAGTTSEKYLSAYEFVLKKLKEFKPEFILFSAGFDAHENDPLAQFQLKSKDFYELTKRTLSLAKSCCNRKVVSVLEGGYDLNALKESVDYHVKSLLE